VSIRSLFEEAEVPSERVRAGDARDRFTTGVARFLRADERERRALTDAILTDARGLRGPDDLRALGDAAAVLVRSAREEGDGAALALAAELLDSQVCTHFAARLGTERDPDALQALSAVALELPSLLAPALAGILAEAPDRAVRRALMDALALAGEEGRAAALALLEDPRWYTVRNGVALLAEVGNGGTVQALTTALAHDDPRVRRETVVTLAKLGGEDAGLLIIGMLDDSSAEVRAAAAQGAGELGVMRGHRALLDLLSGEEDEEVLVQVLGALGRMGDPGAVPAIERRATGSLFSRPPRRVRIAAYRSLAAIGTPHARSVLEAGASDRDPEIRQAVKAVIRDAPKRETQRRPADAPVPDGAST
jgi:hypothetical protein